MTKACVCVNEQGAGVPVDEATVKNRLLFMSLPVRPNRFFATLSLAPQGASWPSWHPFYFFFTESEVIEAKENDQVEDYERPIPAHSVIVRKPPRWLRHGIEWAEAYFEPMKSWPDDAFPGLVDMFIRHPKGFGLLAQARDSYRNEKRKRDRFHLELHALAIEFAGGHSKKDPAWKIISAQHAALFGRSLNTAKDFNAIEQAIRRAGKSL